MASYRGPFQYHALWAWIFIPKPNGDLRPLGIPTVLDRVIQQAIAQVLTPLFDLHFSTHSYGFRYGKQAHQAVRAVEAANAAGYAHAVDCDLKSFFDTVNHDRLRNRLARRIADKRVLQLIGRYLRAGVRLPDGQREATTQGVPQGGPLSPLLANVMLDPLDKELERRGHRFARYADDFLILVKSARAAQRVMQSVIRFVEARLGLVVNRQKSQAAPLHRCAFLGFALRRGQVHGPFYYLTQCLAVGHMTKFLLNPPAAQQTARAATAAFNQFYDGLEELSQINTELLRRGEPLPGAPP